MFYSMRPDGQFDDFSLHGACPVITGEPPLDFGPVLVFVCFFVEFGHAISLFFCFFVFFPPCFLRDLVFGDIVALKFFFVEIFVFVLFSVFLCYQRCWCFGYVLILIPW